MRALNDVLSLKMQGKRGADTTMEEEKSAIFGAVVDLRAAKIRRRPHFALGFTTDGVSAHLLMRNPKKTSTTKGNCETAKLGSRAA